MRSCEVLLVGNSQLTMVSVVLTFRWFLFSVYNSVSYFYTFFVFNFLVHENRNGNGMENENGNGKKWFYAT